MNNFVNVSNVELMSVDGGVNLGLICGGAITIACGVIACGTPGGQWGGAITIYSGAVSVVAGLAY